MSVAFVALGSNLNHPVNQIKLAMDHLKDHPAIQFIQASSFYANPPLGPKDQPDFVNAVAKIKTDLSAFELLKVLQEIEKKQGRMRLIHWGPRTIDLDLLLYDQQVLNEPKLTLPHPGILERSFVLYPLLELDEEIKLPNGKWLKEYQYQVDNNLVPISSPILTVD